MNAQLCAIVLFLSTGCTLVDRVGIGLLTDRVEIPAERVRRDLPYGDHERHRLDFFLPEGDAWPVLVFIHGGGWDAGDKNFRVGGLDVYGNVGRFYAERGVGVAVINYRLQPATGWDGQVEDAGRAAAWVANNAARFGGDSSRLFLMGHSAGAYLASYVALNQGLQAHCGLRSGAVRGFIPVAGAALDLLDHETYRTEDPRYYERRFGPRTDGLTWTRASPTTHADESDPPALVLYGEKDSPGLKRQSERIAGTLIGLGVPAKVVRLPGEDHRRMVLALADANKQAAPAVLAFIEEPPKGL